MNSIRQNIILTSLVMLPPMAIIGGSACSGLSDTSKAELRAAEPAILAADEFACDEAAMIPVVGSLIAAVACPAEVAAVKAAIDSAVAMHDAGVAVGQSVLMLRVYG